MISPKVINIERNRIGSKGGTFHSSNSGNYNYNDLQIESKGIYGNGKGLFKSKTTKNFGDFGRFPTQLFTNIDEEKYKYVKIIEINENKN